jgi:predicted nucleic acid-binding protein
LDLIFQQSHRQLVWFSWRPLSSDPGDDAILEAAIAGGCDYVVSFNERHLRAAKEFGIEVVKPVELLKRIGESK